MKSEKCAAKKQRIHGSRNVQASSYGDLARPAVRLRGTFFAAATAGVVILLISLVPASAIAQGWEAVATSAGAKLYEQNVPGKAVGRFRGVIYLPYAPADVADILADGQGFPHVWRGVESTEVIEETVDEAGRTIVFLEQKSGTAAAPSDVVIRVETWSLNTKRGEAFFGKFRDDQRQPRPASDRGMMQDGRVVGSWTARPARKGTGTRFEYILETDTNQAAPVLLARTAQVDHLSRVLHGVSRRCRVTLGGIVNR
jgi:hypothetical protein